MKSKILFGVIAAMLIIVTAAIGDRPDEVRSLQSEKAPHYQVLGKASIPRLINYQGYLTDTAGNPVTDTLEMTFSIWDDPVGGNQLWSEVLASVPVVNGLFDATLGDFTSIPDSVFAGIECWLQTKVGGETLSPRKQIVSVGYSFRAYQADAADVAEFAEFAEAAGYADSATHAVSSDHASYADSTGVTNYAHDADMVDGQHASDFLSTANDWGRSGVTADLYEGTTALSDKYVNEEQASSITSGMIVDGTIQQADLAFTPGGDGHSLDAADGDPVDAVYVDNDGDVGIGTTSPSYKLDVAGPINLNKGSTGAALRVDGVEALWYNGSYFSWGYGGTGNYFADNVGIGTTNPQEKLHVSGRARFDLGTGQINMSTPGGWPGIIAYSPNGNRRDITIYDHHMCFTVSDSSSSPPSTAGIAISENGNVGIGTGPTWPSEKLDVNGTTRTKVLKITGGSDIAEPFDIKGTDAVKPGMVLTIDAENPGKLKICEEAYDRCVAGIVSGAGDVNPGMIMGQSGSMADGEYPVALTGRVYCWADASNGPIEPGDLLTTSDRSGHAMKVVDYDRAQGAIIGKAMSSLEQGQGLVLVLATLQ